MIAHYVMRRVHMYVLHHSLCPASTGTSASACVNRAAVVLQCVSTMRANCVHMSDLAACLPQGYLISLSTPAELLKHQSCATTDCSKRVKITMQAAVHFLCTDLLSCRSSSKGL